MDERELSKRAAAGLAVTRKAGALALEIRAATPALYDRFYALLNPAA